MKNQCKYLAILFSMLLTQCQNNIEKMRKIAPYSNEVDYTEFFNTFNTKSTTYYDKHFVKSNGNDFVIKRDYNYFSEIKEKREGSFSKNGVDCTFQLIEKSIYDYKVDILSVIAKAQYTKSSIINQKNSSTFKFEPDYNSQCDSFFVLVNQLPIYQDITNGDENVEQQNVQFQVENQEFVEIDLTTKEVIKAAVEPSFTPEHSISINAVGPIIRFAFTSFKGVMSYYVDGDILTIFCQRKEKATFSDETNHFISESTYKTISQLDFSKACYRFESIIEIKETYNETDFFLKVEKNFFDIVTFSNYSFNRV